ncbi:membrane protein [Oxalicibacterium flavum]|uniref:Membrane protein n=1 Tax=Oxalicibacterium flavum TaxID=179467 RepID=A0A8J2UL04_9BURK|nr:OmpA family protein [Oxalicibacterium flavum]GGB97086.1 membrane protein [Oxalicibacterium flavum]
MIKKPAFAFVLGALSACAIAQGGAPSQMSGNGYAQDGQGSIPRSDFGLCWRSGAWTPGDALPGCDGALKSPVPNPIAPDVVNNLEENATPVARCDFSVTLSSDETFAFGQATPNDKARQRITTDVMPRLAACKSVESVVVTGHTDRLGNARANQILSEKRAVNVAALLQKGHENIPINTTGVGSSESQTDCPAQSSKVRQIACLAPDRRVEIVVRGLGR